MKLDCVLSAVNEEKLYIDFVPIFIKTWTKLYPNTDVKVILICENIPNNLLEFKDNIIHFPPLEGVSTCFTSTYIRTLYPAILNYNNGILISDIDMLPMNRTYYSENIKKYDNDKFIYLRHVCLRSKEIAICYNVATPKIWGEIYNIKTLDDIKQTLTTRFKSIKYIDGPPGKKRPGYNTDQLDLYKKVHEWHEKTNNFIILKDSETGFKRLCRSQRFTLNEKTMKNISNGVYSDCHTYRPYSTYKEINDKIYELL